MDRKSVFLPQESEKLYFVKRRTMRSGEREPRKIKKVERKMPQPPYIKKAAQRLKYKQRGLTEIGQKREKIMEARSAPFEIPTVAQMLFEEKLKQKAITPKAKEQAKAKEAELEEQMKQPMRREFELEEEEPPAYSETERAIVDMFPHDTVSKRGLKFLREVGLKGKQYRTTIKELDKLSSDDIRYLMSQYVESLGDKADETFLGRLDSLRASKQARGMGLKMKKGRVGGGGLLSTIKDLAKDAIQKAKKDPIKTAMSAFELAQKAKDIYKDKKAREEEARKERVRKHIMSDYGSS